MAQDHAALLHDPRRRGDQLRGHRRQVHRRRDHGRVRRPGRPRGPRPARLLRGAADARRRRRVRGRAAPRAGAQLLDPDRDQLRRGGRRGDRRRRRRRLHRDRPHRRPGAADGGAGRARPRLPDRAHRRARRRLPRRSTTSASSRSRGRASRSRSTSWPGSARPARGSTSPASAASPASSAAARRWRRWRRRWPRAEARRGRRRSAIVAEPGVGKSRLCHEFAERCRGEGLEVFEAQAQAHGTLDPVHAGAADAARLLRRSARRARAAWRARRSPAARCCSTPSFAEELPLIFDFLGVPDPERPLAAAERRGAPARAGRDRLPARQRAEAAQDAGPGGRGPALDRRRQRGDAGRAGRLDRRHATRSRSSTSGPSTRPPGPARPLPPALAGAADPPTPRELLRDLAGDDPSLDGLDEPIHERTRRQPVLHRGDRPRAGRGGHLEGERGAYRLARPIEDAGVPATVQAVLAARIDRLDPAAKQLLQVASVVGKEVSDAALGLTAGPASAEEIEPVAARADRRRLPLRGRALPAAGARLPPPADPRGRLRQPAGRSAGARPTRRRRGR